MNNLVRRLSQLEASRRDGGVIVMWRHVDEPESAAKERWCMEHPGQDPDAAGLQVIILRWSGNDDEDVWRETGEQPGAA